MVEGKEYFGFSSFCVDTFVYVFFVRSREVRFFLGRAGIVRSFLVLGKDV